MDPTVANSRKTKRTRTPSAKATEATAAPPKKLCKSAATSGNCGKEFRDKHALTTHMRTHTGEKPFQCSKCGQAFARKSTLIRHMRTHTGEKPFQCNKCGQAFASKSSLSRHMRTHTGEKPFQCGDYEKTFASKSNLKQHMRTHTGEKPFQCNKCGAANADKGTLSRHMRTHTGEKPFQCNKCGAANADKGTLSRHMRTHTGEKPHKCDDCEKTFASKSTLIRHMRTHTGEKPFQCNKCGAANADKGTLSRHMRTHTGEKPHKCDDCEKTFASKSTLIRHMRTHTGEKPLQCNKCGAAFARKSNLSRHMRTHTGEKPFQCGDCGQASADKRCLKSRFKRHHTREGQAKRKLEEQRVCRYLLSREYTQADSLGDSAPPVMQFCRERHIVFSCADDMDSKYARIDFVINPGGAGNSLILLEVDEDQHRFGYGEAGCDMKRMGKVMESLALAECIMRVVWLRYNPNSFKVDGVPQNARKPQFSHYKKNSREQWLVRRIAELGTEDDIEPGLSTAIEYAYYDCDSTESTTLPMVACIDAGYSSHYAEITRISPGCMHASSSSPSSAASSSSPSSAASSSSPSSAATSPSPSSAASSPSPSSATSSPSPSSAASSPSPSSAASSPSPSSAASSPSPSSATSSNVELNGEQLNDKIVSALLELASLWNNVELEVIEEAARQWQGVSDPARLAQTIFNEKHWRVRCYNQAANAIYSSSTAYFKHNLADIQQLPGIGDGILKNVKEFVDTSHLQSHAWLLGAQC